MRLVRRYPEPDPLMRVFAEDAIPDGVWQWPAQERSQRLRYALISLCAGIHPVIAWPLAFDDTDESNGAIERTLEALDDHEIGKMVQSTASADWMAQPR